MKSDESNILSELIDKHIQTIVNKVVFQIRRVPKDAMISGDDSGLKSHWDELCVQVQDEHFQNWNLFDDLVENICEDKYKELPDPIQYALSYKACELNDVAYEPDTVFPELIVEMLKEKVYEYAMNYENRQIREYIYR